MFESIQARCEIAARRRTVSSFGEREPCVECRFPEAYCREREVDEIAGQRGLVEAAIGIRQKLFRYGVLRPQDGDAKVGIENAFEVDTALEHNLEFQARVAD